MAFAKCRNGELLPIRCILDRFPQSHYRPSQADGQVNSPNAIPNHRKPYPSQLLSNGRFFNRDKHLAKATLARVHELRSVQGCDFNISCDFTVCETELAIKQLRVGKAPGVDNIHPEYIKYQGRKATEWLSKFFSTCM